MLNTPSFRQRTFSVEVLFDAELLRAESLTKLPIRANYALLHFMSDRAGRLCLADTRFDNAAFDTRDVILQCVYILSLTGHVLRYFHCGSEYLFLPSFINLPNINNQEPASLLPSLSSGWIAIPSESLNDSVNWNVKFTPSQASNIADLANYCAFDTANKGEQFDPDFPLGFIVPGFNSYSNEIPASITDAIELVSLQNYSHDFHLEFINNAPVGAVIYCNYGSLILRLTRKEALLSQLYGADVCIAAVGGDCSEVVATLTTAIDIDYPLLKRVGLSKNRIEKVSAHYSSVDPYFILREVEIYLTENPSGVRRIDRILPLIVTFFRNAHERNSKSSVRSVGYTPKDFTKNSNSGMADLEKRLNLASLKLPSLSRS